MKHSCYHSGGQYFSERQSIQMNTAAARSTDVTESLTDCPHNGGQYFAEKQCIKTNAAAARSTAVTEM